MQVPGCLWVQRLHDAQRLTLSFPLVHTHLHLLVVILDYEGFDGHDRNAHVPMGECRWTIG